MKTLLRICIVVGYLLFGVFWSISLYNVVVRNVYVNFFTIEKVKVSNLTYSPKTNDSSQLMIKYEYIVDSLNYNKELTVSQEAFEKKVGFNVDSINVCYNEFIPSVSYLEGWELKSYYKITFIFFSIFLSIVIFVDFRVDKEKWITKYFKAITGRAP